MKSEWQDKVWGKTREVISSPFYSKHQLEVVAGGFCSLHYHQNRANRFTVESGNISVVLFFGPRIKRHSLGPDNVLDVPSLVPHMFLVHTPGFIVEEYYPDRCGEVSNDDIIRLYEGGWREADYIYTVPFEILSELIS